MTTSGNEPSVLVVGAGLSGLVAARSLAASGRIVNVIDKGRSVGGRLATRRLVGFGDEVALLDHGAQFFTTRSLEFSTEVEHWLSLGLAREWCRGFDETQDGYPRYCAPLGMNSIAKHLAADLNVSCDIVASAVHQRGTHVEIETTSGQTFAGNSLVLTPPVPQALALCDRGNWPLSDAERATLEAIRYVPCIALLVTLDRPSAVPAPGGLQLTSDQNQTFSFVGDNRAKGLSSVPALTFHANDHVSASRYDEADETLRSHLLTEAEPFFGGAVVVACEVKRWRFARPSVTHVGRSFNIGANAGGSVVFAGDAFGEGRVEGAFLSGLAAAESIILAPGRER